MSVVVYVGGFPVGHGGAVADGYPAENGEVPLPDWSAFEDEDLADLDDKARVEFREQAIPPPEHVIQPGTSNRLVRVASRAGQLRRR